MALPPRHRLRDADALRRLARMKPAASAGFITLRCAPAPSGSRFAVLVPARSVPSAAARNAIRRRMTGALAPLAARCRNGVQCVLTVRGEGVPQGAELRAVLSSLFAHAGILAP